MNEIENLSKVCQTFCLLEQKVQQACQTCQTCRFRNWRVNQTQIPSLLSLPLSELVPVKHTLSLFYFILQDIDGHAFLLLTLNELHNLMRIPVGPAAKLTDYIHTLQRDCARFSSKSTGATPSTTSGAEVRSENSRVTTKQQPTAKTAKSSTAKTSRTSSPEISSAPQIVDVYRISKPLFSRLKQS